MNRRRFLALSVSASSTLLLAACGATATPTATPPRATPAIPPTPTAAPRRVRQIGFATHVGRIDDQSFNQSTWEGAQAAASDLGAAAKYIVTIDAKDFPKNIAQFAEAGYDVIITAGFAYGPQTIEAAKKWPEIHFVGVDQFQEQPLPNLATLVFEEDKAGFLAGALAAQMSQSAVIGAVLGTDVVPTVVKYGKGFENGAKYINAGIRVLTAYHPGGVEKGFSDPDWGATTARAMIDQKADVIFAAGGNTGNGALLYCAKPDVNVMAIGVDSDQYLTLTGAQKVLISSAMKLILAGVTAIIKSIAAGSFQGGNVTGAVGLAPYHEWENRIPQSVKDKMASIDKGVRDGSIPTGVMP